MEHNEFFAAVNSSEGFRSFFGEIFDPERMRRIVILKGGPGTGKSTMLRAFCRAAEEGGYRTEVFLCSADPASLDAVLLPEEGIAVLDGTAPHTVEPHYPGAVEEIFDAGAFWDAAALRQKREIFFPLVRRKGEEYRRGFRLLSTAGELARELRLLAFEGADEEKMNAAAARQFSSLLRAEQEGRGMHRQLSAMSAGGKRCLDTCHALARVRVRVTPACGTGNLYLSLIRTRAKYAGISYYQSADPLSPDLPDALYFPEGRVLFFVGEPVEEYPEDKTVNLGRFLSRETMRAHKNRIRFLEKCIEGLSGRACLSFAAAADVHALLEEDYVRAMDFDALSRAWQARIGELLTP